MLNKKIEQPTSEAKILEKLAIQLDENDWISIYCIPFWATVEVKLRSFQISINHFYYFTNEKLHLIGLSNTPYCYFCEGHFETIQHLFIDCPYVTHLWLYIETLMAKIGPEYQLDTPKKLFGFYSDYPHVNILNHLTIVTKHFIHMSKSKKVIPTLNNLKKRISDTEFLERQIAFQKQKIEIHEDKWRCLSA